MDNLLLGMNHLQGDSTPPVCPAPFLQGWPISSETVAYFTPKGWPVCSESPADLLRDTQIPSGFSVADRMRHKLNTKKGRQIYGLRKELPEPVFGQIKQVRGFRLFLLRGLEKVSGEWKVIRTGHDLLKLF
jgi:Transposase DDE domain